MHRVVSNSARADDSLPPEAHHLAPLRGDFSAMAKRRFQSPSPFREGKWWWISPWQDFFNEGRLERKRKRIKVCPAETPEREARKMAAEMLRPMNQGLQTIGSATRFAEYVNGTYRPIVLPLMANTTQASYEGTLRKYLMPAFGEMPLRDLSTLSLQKYFSGLGTSELGGDTVLKIKEVLSAVLGSAVRYDLLTKNPLLAVQIPRSKVVNRRKQKPHVTPEEFEKLVDFVDEPYATMIYVAVFSGLRVSELVGLKWEDVRSDALTVDERFCRGNWSVTKTAGSATTIGVASAVIARIHRLKTLEVQINWGGSGARKRIKLVRSEGPQDLVSNRCELALQCVTAMCYAVICAPPRLSWAWIPRKRRGARYGHPVRHGWSKQALIRKTFRGRCDTRASLPRWTSMRRTYPTASVEP